MTDYDRWLESPYTDRDEPDECPDCGGDGKNHKDAPGPGFVDVCPTCEGEGCIPAPTREEIEERRAEERFDQMRDEGRI